MAPNSRDLNPVDYRVSVACSRGWIGHRYRMWMILSNAWLWGGLVCSSQSLTRIHTSCDPTLLLCVLAVLGLYATSSQFVTIIIIIDEAIDQWW